MDINRATSTASRFFLFSFLNTAVLSRAFCELLFLQGVLVFCGLLARAVL